MNILKHKNLTINLDTISCYVKDKEINLTKTEYNLLLYLLDNINKIISRKELSSAIWNKQMLGRAVDTTVSRLRKKLGTSIIQTRQGFGYGIFE